MTFIVKVNSIFYKILPVIYIHFKDSNVYSSFSIVQHINIVLNNPGFEESLRSFFKKFCCYLEYCEIVCHVHSYRNYIWNAQSGTYHTNKIQLTIWICNETTSIYGSKKSVTDIAIIFNINYELVYFELSTCNVIVTISLPHLISFSVPLSSLFFSIVRVLEYIFSINCAPFK